MSCSQFNYMPDIVLTFCAALNEPLAHKPRVTYLDGICKSCQHWRGREGAGANSSKFKSSCLLKSEEAAGLGRPLWVDTRWDESCEQWEKRRD